MSKIGLHALGTRQVGTVQHRVRELCANKLCTTEIGAAQVRVLQVEPRQVDTRKVFTDQPNPAQVTLLRRERPTLQLVDHLLTQGGARVVSFVPARQSRP